MSYGEGNTRVISWNTQEVEVLPSWAVRVKKYSRSIFRSKSSSRTSNMVLKELEEFSAFCKLAHNASLATKRKAKRKPPKARSTPTPIDPVPLMEREIGTVKEAAAVGPWTEGALRHRIWLSEAHASTGFEGKPELAEFAKCIHRPRGQRRVYLNIPRLIALMKGEGCDHA